MLDILLFLFLILFLLLFYVWLYLACIRCFSVFIPQGRSSWWPKEASPGHHRENSRKAGLKHLSELLLTTEGLQIIPHSYSLLNAERWMCCLYPGSR